jgi:hypothetical protein
MRKSLATPEFSRDVKFQKKKTRIRREKDLPLFLAIELKKITGTL